jgi:hypothetical protein
MTKAPFDILKTLGPKKLGQVTLLAMLCRLVLKGAFVYITAPENSSRTTL